MREYSVIGKRLPRLDSNLKVTGEANFTGDIRLPGMLYGKILRSPYPHAKILNIDISKALKLPGVKAVVTGKDTPGIKYGCIDIPQYPADKNPLAVDKVRYIGDDVAAVAAIDEDTAEEALELIHVDYEPLPAVFDPEEAMREDSPLIHEYTVRNIDARYRPDELSKLTESETVGLGHNICAKIYWDFGDIDEGFKNSDYIREDTFRTASVTHCPLEPHAALAHFDSQGKLTVWSSTQTPYMRRTHLAKTFNMPESKIRVINPFVGGGFGGKTITSDVEFAASLLSMKTGKPVSIYYTREEMFTASTKRHPMIIRLKTGVKKDGTLIATSCYLIADGGAYATTGPIVIFLAGAFLVTVYRMQNVRFEGYRVYTNNYPSGPQRGHGAVQPRFAFDSHLDMIAEDLGMDYLDICLKNAIKPGDITPNKFRVNSCGLEEGIKKASEITSWRENRKRKKGIGMSAGSFISGMLIPPHTSSAAFIKLHEDGGVTLIAGIPEIGQGSDTAISMIVAEELGISIEDIQVTTGDTELTPPHAGSYSSRGTLWAGKAVREAALDVKKQIFEVAADLLEADPEDLEAKDRNIYVKGSPGKSIPFRDVVVASYLSKEGNPILGKGYYKPPIDLVNFDTGEGNLTPAYSFSAQVAEVDVDKETGDVKLNNMVVAHDSGLTINPMAVEGQLEGSVSMGQGQSLLEEGIFEKGQVLNPSFLSYKLPLACDTPNIKTVIVESEDPSDPFLPKEAGEGTQVSTPGAIANAVYNATGVRIKELPITPEKILKGLEEKGGGI